MYSTTHFLVFSILLYCVGVQCNVQRSFDIVLMNYTVENNPEYLEIEHVMKKAGTVEASVSITYKVLKDFPLDIDLSLRIEREVYGQYVTAGMPLEKPYCDYIKNDKAFYPSIIKYGENMPRRCPIKKGTIFKLLNFNMNQFDLPMAILPNGDYRITIALKFPNKPVSSSIFTKIQSST